MSSPRVLLVDDDPAFRQLVRPVLESRGYEVLEAPSGEEGKRLVRARGVDAVIVDGLLPDGDGVVWIAWLRKTGLETPVAFVSTFDRQGELFDKLVHELHVGLVARKPLDLGVFGDQLDRLLGRRPILAPVEAAAKDDAAELELALLKLRHEYALGLPDTVANLSTAIAHLGTHPADEESRAQALLISHRLQGTAGTYGFVELGEAAGRIEEVLSEPVKADGAASWLTVVDALSACQKLAGRARHDAAPPVLPVRVQAPISVAPHTQRGQTLLVVDDDPGMLNLLSELARRHTLKILTARSAAEALAVASATPPDAALLDVNLGENELSFRLPFELRSLPGQESLPVGFMSTVTRMEHRVGAAYAGGSLFLRKPIDPVAFGNAARQLLDARRGETPVVMLGSGDDALIQWAREVLAKNNLRLMTIDQNGTIEAALVAQNPDLLLLDASWERVNAFDLCRAIRLDSATRDLPVVCLAGRSSRDSLLAACNAGADDLWQQPLNEEEFLVRVATITQRQRFRREHSSSDPLTGLRSRPDFLTQASQQLERMQTIGQTLSLALIDLDEFTALNDKYGSAVGDRVLTGFSQVLRNTLMSDFVRGRWSGDEFAIAFPGEDASTAHQVLQRLARQVAALPLRDGKGQPLQVSFCGGIACSLTDGTLVDDLRRVAERRLRAARKNGRGAIASVG